jgi:hypothetical protein
LSAGACAGPWCGCARACGGEAVGVDGVVGDVGELLVGVALEEGGIDRRDRAHVAEEHDFAGELALVFGEVVVGLDVDEDGVAGDGAAGGRRPGRGLGDEDGGVGSGHADPGVELLPAHAEFTPVVEVGVDAAHCGELIAGPGIGFGEVGRAGEAGADVVGEGGAVVHDMGVEEAFFADAGVHGEVEFFGGGLRLGPGAVIGVSGSGCWGWGRFLFVRGEEREGGEQNERGDAARAQEHGCGFLQKSENGERGG